MPNLGSLRTPMFSRKCVIGHLPASRGAATTDTTGIDVRGYKYAQVVLLCGATTATGTLDVTVRESDNSDGSSSAAIPGATFAQVTPSNDDATYTGTIYLPPRKRYLVIRAITATAASVFASLVILSGKRTEPADSTPVFEVYS